MGRSDENQSTNTPPTPTWIYEMKSKQEVKRNYEFCFWNRCSQFHDGDNVDPELTLKQALRQEVKDMRCERKKPLLMEPVFSQPGSGYPLGSLPGSGCPVVPDGFPQGLAILAGLDRVVISQSPDNIGCTAPCSEWRHKAFAVYDSKDTEIFTGDDYIERACLCFGSRTVAYFIKDINGDDLMTFRHPIKCCGRWCEIYIPDDTLVATASKTFSCTSELDFEIFDQNDQKLYRVLGPCSMPCCCGGCCVCDLGCSGPVYRIYSEARGGEQIGEIAVMWDGCFGKCCTAAWRVEITFPIDLDVVQKSILMGASYLCEALFERARTR